MSPRVEVTTHAVERYIERVMRAQAIPDARLYAMVRAEIRSKMPWYAVGMTGDVGVDGAVFVLKKGAVVTVLTEFGSKARAKARATA